ncbi:MAG: hypothetical protein IT428_26680 [Planctomycetaceae bacterium]|nr:hypothetical protein [Planctomycetaceae bacterium]
MPCSNAEPRTRSNRTDWGAHMDPQELESRLSQISTLWSVIQRAHVGKDAAFADYQALAGRYIGAVYRYLLAAVRNPDSAEDLTQEFAVRFLSGRFKAARPERGRFRDYLKTCLFHLVDDHFRQRRRNPQAQALESGMDVADPRESSSTQDAAFLESWRSELLARTWTALHEAERQTGQLYFTALRCRVDHPDLSSTELAEKFSAALDRPMTASNTRQLLRRARERFEELLFAETAASLGTESHERIREELADLGLGKYCEKKDPNDE